MFKQLIIKISRSLDKEKIPYMIIGGQAVLLYGSPRLTKDIDITLGINIDRLSQLVKLVKLIKLTIIPHNFKDFAVKTMVLPTKDIKTGIRVDFIFSFTPYEQQAINRVNKVKLGKTTVRFASVEDLIIHKIISGRPKDMEDIESIILKHHQFDVAYIKKWLKNIGSLPEDKRNLLKVFTNLLKMR